MPTYNFGFPSISEGCLYFSKQDKEGNTYYIKFDGLKNVIMESTMDGLDFCTAPIKHTTITIDSENISFVKKENETKEEIKEEEIIQLMEGEML